MSRKRASRAGGSLAVLMIAGAAYLAAPGAPRAQSAEDSDCSLENTGPVCSIEVTCSFWWWFWPYCETEYKRLPPWPV